MPESQGCWGERCAGSLPGSRPGLTPQPGVAAVHQVRFPVFSHVDQEKTWSEKFQSKLSFFAKGYFYSLTQKVTPNQRVWKNMTRFSRGN